MFILITNSILIFINVVFAIIHLKKKHYYFAALQLTAGILITIATIIGYGNFSN